MVQGSTKTLRSSPKKCFALKKKRGSRLEEGEEAVNGKGIEISLGCTSVCSTKKKSGKNLTVSLIRSAAKFLYREEDIDRFLSHVYANLRRPVAIGLSTSRQTKTESHPFGSLPG